MRPGATKIESGGSYWWFDETAKEYMRLPKHEGPRERAEWSDQRAGPLQDAVWHPYDHFFFEWGRLWIMGADCKAIASAPMGDTA